MSYEIHICREGFKEESLSFGWGDIRRILQRIRDDSVVLFPGLSLGCQASMEMGYFWIDSDLSDEEVSLILNSLRSVRKVHELEGDLLDESVVVQESDERLGAQLLTVGDLRKSFGLGLDHLISILDRPSELKVLGEEADEMKNMPSIS